ncbi:MULTISPECIES: L-rhamnose/proton symporter RhaT [Asticcacaulis]|uniref:L-rhamnose/proton symporter RhaT n=1 Tax=Asticcacaulis TaxID=76890 RepID=UPI001AE41BEB|nr:MULTISPECIES: L-rhamnose/proton symporter RhaT [Asticcacaulis]MBP2160821.1 L-rhamnose-H+ transport protein [Asticcacaulis solisilvae]MDR6801975.1 L-rhamnose-H+ transport protein [Asticcacaulis sp. BE141]
MTPNPLIGVFFHWLGGLASASFYVPYKRIRLWSWEIFWLTGGIFSWVFAPWLFASIQTKDLLGVIGSASPDVLWACIGCGALWGMGGLTFGLTMRYLGLSLGMAVALGLTTVIGTLGPPLFNGTLGEVATKPGAVYTFVGIAVVLVAIVVVAMAGHRKEIELPGEKEGLSEFHLSKGLMVAVFCGVMSSFFAFGLERGTPIKDASLAAGTGPLWAGLPVLCVVLIGGFLTNLVWSGYLILKNKSAGEWVGRAKEPGTKIPLLLNYGLAALGGTLWYFQFFFYTMGESQMGAYGFSSWTLHMASIILFSTLWGFALKEWKGTSVKTKAYVWTGILALVASTVIIGYGNMLAG